MVIVIIVASQCGPHTLHRPPLRLPLYLLVMAAAQALTLLLLCRSLTLALHLQPLLALLMLLLALQHHEASLARRRSRLRQKGAPRVTITISMRSRSPQQQGRVGLDCSKDGDEALGVVDGRVDESEAWRHGQGPAVGKLRVEQGQDDVVDDGLQPGVEARDVEDRDDGPLQAKADVEAADLADEPVGPAEIGKAAHGQIHAQPQRRHVLALDNNIDVNNKAQAAYQADGLHARDVLDHGRLDDDAHGVVRELEVQLGQDEAEGRRVQLDVLLQRLGQIVLRQVAAQDARLRGGVQAGGEEERVEVDGHLVLRLVEGQRQRRRQRHVRGGALGRRGAAEELCTGGHADPLRVDRQRIVGGRPGADISRVQHGAGLAVEASAHLHESAATAALISQADRIGLAGDDVDWRRGLRVVLGPAHARVVRLQRADGDAGNVQLIALLVVNLHLQGGIDIELEEARDVQAVVGVQLKGKLSPQLGVAVAVEVVLRALLARQGVDGGGVDEGVVEGEAAVEQGEAHGHARQPGVEEVGQLVLHHALNLVLKGALQRAAQHVHNRLVDAAVAAVNLNVEVADGDVALLHTHGQMPLAGVDRDQQVEGGLGNGVAGRSMDVDEQVVVAPVHGGEGRQVRGLNGEEVWRCEHDSLVAE
eukprot:m.71528 g.71528  ORF g.71528 m.71528 type:complete len:648 (+) comp14368_c1_seq1:231-2174(+)